MRLTLRTLLAYLDDTLEPAQARLIGQKVAESDQAQELIARIKQVTRRRRLTTPPVTGPGAKVDTNKIAEYLDNVLPGEEVGEVEEACIESDVYLAEVAACHQILTLILGEPALVPPTARERMYGLIKGPESIRNRKAAAPAVSHVAAETTGEDDEATMLGLPLRSSASSRRWLIPLAAACLFLAGGLAIGMALMSSVPNTGPFPHADARRQLALAHAEENHQPVPAEAKKSDTEAKLPATESPKASGETSKPSTDPKPEAKSQIKPESKQEPKPEAKTGTEPPAPNNKPEATPPSVEKTKPTGPVPVRPPSTERREIGKYTMVPPSILLTRTTDQGGWQRLKPNSAVQGTDYLMSLPGYHSELVLESGVHLDLWGNLPDSPRVRHRESAITLHYNPAFDLDFTLVRGRVILSNRKPAGPAQVRARFADEVWDLTLPDSSCEMALELAGFCFPYTKEPGGGDPGTAVNLLALRGQGKLRVRYEEFPLASPAIFSWDSDGGGAKAAQPIKPPEWWANKPTFRPTLVAALDGLAKRLIAKDNLDVALAESISQADISGRMLAVLCLGAMDDYARLVDTLSDGRHLDAAALGRDGLKHLLGFSRKNDERLLKALKLKGYADSLAKSMLQLLHGFSDEQWADGGTRATVVEYLMHDKQAVRVLAHLLLTEQVPDGIRIRYDPAGDSAQRERGYEEWRKLVSAGKVPPKIEGLK